MTLGRKTLAAPGNRTSVNGVPVLCSDQLSYIPSRPVTRIALIFFFFFFNEKNDDIEILTLTLQRRRDEIEIVLTRSDALSAVVDGV